jgi:hypothetical protein
MYWSYSKNDATLISIENHARNTRGGYVGMGTWSKKPIPCYGYVLAGGRAKLTCIKLAQWCLKIKQWLIDEDAEQEDEQGNAKTHKENWK